MSTRSTIFVIAPYLLSAFLTLVPNGLHSMHYFTSLAEPLLAFLIPAIARGSNLTCYPEFAREYFYSQVIIFLPTLSLPWLDRDIFFRGGYTSHTNRVATQKRPRLYLASAIFIFLACIWSISQLPILFPSPLLAECSKFMLAFFGPWLLALPLYLLIGITIIFTKSIINLGGNRNGSS